MCIRGRALLCCGLWVTSLKGMVGTIPPLGTQAHKKHENAQAIVSFCAGIRCPSSRAENRRVLCVPKMPQHKMSHDHSQPCATGAGGAGAVACSSVDDPSKRTGLHSHYNVSTHEVRGAIENAPVRKHDDDACRFPCIRAIPCHSGSRLPWCFAASATRSSTVVRTAVSLLRMHT